MEGILNNHRENRLKTGLKKKIEKEKAKEKKEKKRKRGIVAGWMQEKKSSLLIGLLRLESLKGETGGLD